ncbi:Protein PHYTOCHROME KINASE SUBSTRATE 2 [Linum grandiflorum]
MASLPFSGNFKETLASANTKNNEVSFSSYLDRSEKGNTPSIHTKRGDENEDEGIGIFSAEKYFNGAIDETTKTPRPRTRHEKKEVEEVDVGVKSSSHIRSSATPSLKSESSWYSHTLLLKKSFRNKGKKSLISGLTCRCYCSDKKSVDVKEEQVGDISFRGDQIPEKPIPEKKKKQTSFSFPITPDTVLSGFDEPKLFGQRKKLEEPEGYESDASSDLFEIESLTGNKVASFLARQGSCATSGCITPIYAPSEASVDWSVVTASATDFSGPIPKMRLPRRGSLLGCKTGEAVSPSAYRVKQNTTKAEVGSRSFRASDSSPRPGLKVQPERKMSGFDSRNRQHHHHPVSNQAHADMVIISDHKFNR